MLLLLLPIVNVYAMHIFLLPSSPHSSFFQLTVMIFSAIELKISRLSADT